MDIKKLRKKLNITQIEMSKILNNSFSTISRLENGSVKLTDDQLEILEAVEELFDLVPKKRKKIIKAIEEIGVKGVVSAFYMNGMLENSKSFLIAKVKTNFDFLLTPIF